MVLLLQAQEQVAMNPEYDLPWTVCWMNLMQMFPMGKYTIFICKNVK
jgi:hypothetical protein